MKLNLVALLMTASAAVHALPISTANTVTINPPYIHTAVRLEFNSVTGTYYQVQITDDLIGGTWDNEGYAIKGNGGTMDALASSRSYDPAYFRLLDNGSPNNTAPSGPQGPKGDKGDTGAEGPVGAAGPQGPKGDLGVVSAELPLNISTNKIIGLNPASMDGDVLTWSAASNHWISARPSTLSVIPTTESNIQPYNTVNFIIALNGTFPSRSGYANPTYAEIVMFAGNFAPRNFAFCDGQLLPISQYSALFSLLGTQYGGDGRSTFALPDMRGRVAIHPGSGPGLSTYRQGDKGGNEIINTHRH